jgi:hypothetical protein
MIVRSFVNTGAVIFNQIIHYRRTCRIHKLVGGRIFFVPKLQTQFPIQPLPNEL